MPVISEMRKVPLYSIISPLKMIRQARKVLETWWSSVTERKPLRHLAFNPLKLTGIVVPLKCSLHRSVCIASHCGLINSRDKYRESIMQPPDPSALTWKIIIFPLVSRNQQVLVNLVIGLSKPQ
ncbi:hypothetical protein SLA2020_085090 [Shorea laevis]